MSKTFVSVGSFMNITASGAKVAGEVHEMAACIGVWENDTADGAVGAVGITGGRRLAKEPGVAFTAGDALYWDAVNDRLDKTDTNIPAGVAFADAGSAATTAVVILGYGL